MNITDNQNPIFDITFKPNPQNDYYQMSKFYFNINPTNSTFFYDNVNNLLYCYSKSVYKNLDKKTQIYPQILLLDTTDTENNFIVCFDDFLNDISFESTLISETPFYKSLLGNYTNIIYKNEYLYSILSATVTKIILKTVDLITSNNSLIKINLNNVLLIKAPYNILLSTNTKNTYILYYNNQIWVLKNIIIERFLTFNPPIVFPKEETQK